MCQKIPNYDIVGILSLTCELDPISDKLRIYLAGYDPLDREDVEEWEKGESAEDMNKIFQFFFHTGPAAKKAKTDKSSKRPADRRRPAHESEDEDEDEEFLRESRRRKAEKKTREEREKLIREDERRKIQVELSKKAEHDRKKQEEDEKRSKVEERRRYKEEMKLKMDLEEERRALERERKRDEHKRKELEEQERKVREEKMSLMREQLAHEEQMIKDLKRRRSSGGAQSGQGSFRSTIDDDEADDEMSGRRFDDPGSARKKSRKKGKRSKKKSGKSTFGSNFGADPEFTKGTDGKWYEKGPDGKWVVSSGPDSRKRELNRDAKHKGSRGRQFNRDGKYQDSLGRIYDRAGNEYVLQPNGGLKRIYNSQAGRSDLRSGRGTADYDVDDFGDNAAGSWRRADAAKSATYQRDRRASPAGQQFQSAHKLTEEIMQQQEMIAQRLMRAQQQQFENRKRKAPWHEEL